VQAEPSATNGLDGGYISSDVRDSPPDLAIGNFG
jgi:hypothetical protein